MVAYGSLKTKEKCSLGNLKSGRGLLRMLFIKFKSQFKRGFTKVVVARADGLQVRSQGELQLYQLKQVYNSYR